MRKVVMMQRIGREFVLLLIARKHCLRNGWEKKYIFQLMNLLIILSVGYFIILWHLEIPCQDFSSRSFKTKKAEKLQGFKKTTTKKTTTIGYIFALYSKLLTAYIPAQLLKYQPNTWQQPSEFRHASMVKTTCWSSNWATSEWGRSVFLVTLSIA